MIGINKKLNTGKTIISKDVLHKPPSHFLGVPNFNANNHLSIFKRAGRTRHFITKLQNQHPRDQPVNSADSEPQTCKNALTIALVPANACFYIKDHYGITQKALDLLVWLCSRFATLERQQVPSRMRYSIKNHFASDSWSVSQGTRITQTS